MGVGYPVCLRSHAASCSEEAARSALLDHNSVVHEPAEGEDNHTALGKYHVHPDAPDEGRRSRTLRRRGRRLHLIIRGQRLTPDGLTGADQGLLWALTSASDNSLTGQRTRRTMAGEGSRPLTWQGRRGRAWQGARGGARRGTACLAWRGGVWHSRTARTDRRQTWRRDTRRRGSVPPVV